jgi:hypothetical protein
MLIAEPRLYVSVPGAATRPNDVWSCNFMSDATVGGRRMKVLTGIDGSTREALAAVPATIGN